MNLTKLGNTRLVAGGTFAQRNPSTAISSPWHLDILNLVASL